jgi:hypothetical protein
MSTQEELDLLEGRIRSALDKERAPIIGPCLESIRNGDSELLAHPLFDRLKGAMRRGQDDSAGRLNNALSKWPAVTVIMLTQAVSDGYNDDNEYAIHSIVEEILGLNRKTTTKEREQLWRSFRDACRHLGLECNVRDFGAGYLSIQRHSR